MADFTTIASMVTIPEHFAKYVVDRTTELNTFVNAGIASPDERVAQLINGSPEGGRFIYLPSFNPLEGEEDVFGEDEVTIGGIDTKEAKQCGFDHRTVQAGLWMPVVFDKYGK